VVRKNGIRRRIDKGAIQRIAEGALTPKISKAFESFLATAGITDQEWRAIMNADPRIGMEIVRKVGEKMVIGLVMVWDAMFEKAANGDVPAAKLIMQRFDDGFIEKMRHEHVDIDLPSHEHFDKMMENRFGKERWGRLQAEAQMDDDPGGVFGENYLPGGSQSDRLIEGAVLPASVEPPGSSAEELFR